MTGRLDGPRVTSLSELGGWTVQELHHCREWEVGRSKSYIVVVTGRLDGNVVAQDDLRVTLLS